MPNQNQVANESGPSITAIRVAVAEQYGRESRKVGHREPVQTIRLPDGEIDLNALRDTIRESNE